MGFIEGGKLRKVNLLDGGPPMDLCDIGAPRGAWWGPDGFIYYTPGSSGGLRRISTDGGESETVTELEETNAEWTHRWPQVLPGGQAVLFTVGDEDMFSGFDEAKIYVQSLLNDERRLLIEGGSFARYVQGHIVYVRSGVLMAARFDAERLEIVGRARPVLEWIKWFPINGTAQFALSHDGSLVYVPGGPEWEEPRRLVWVNRQGESKPVTDDTRLFYDPGLSPDGRKIAVAIAREGNTDLWLHDVKRDALSRLTASGGEDLGPLWTPDGQRIAYYYSMTGPFQIFSRAADGSGEPQKIHGGENSQRPESWSPDGKVLVFSENDPETGFDIWSLAMDDIEGSKPEPIIKTTFDELHGKLSPDGRWPAVRLERIRAPRGLRHTIPWARRKWQISTHGGDNPNWTRGGRELVYIDGSRMMAVSITTQPELAATKPRLLFEWRQPPRLFEGLYRRYYDVSSDGETFLMVQGGERETSKQLHVVLHWGQELQN